MGSLFFGTSIPYKTNHRIDENQCDGKRRVVMKPCLMALKRAEIMLFNVYLLCYLSIVLVSTKF